MPSAPVGQRKTPPMPAPTRTDPSLPLSERLLQADLPQGAFRIEDGVEIHHPPIRVIDGVPHVQCVQIHGYAQAASQISWRPVPLRAAAQALQASHPDLAARVSYAESALIQGATHDADGDAVWLPRMRRIHGVGHVELNGAWIEVPVGEAVEALRGIEWTREPGAPTSAPPAVQNAALERTMNALRDAGAGRPGQRPLRRF